MDESFGRRTVLRTICGVVTGTGAGCVSRPSGERKRSPTPTPSSTDEKERNRRKNCQPVPDSDGAPKPWFDPDSSVDIEIGNGVQSDIEATLTIDDSRREISIPAEDRWLSEDIIDDGERPTITVATENLEARLQWKGERNNSGIAVFVVRENRIDATFTRKFCSKFTS
ncbi:hypothetical protein [Haladaptatus sp. CMAA 1911]|uniref:hypothetical protein n=1 Tax=unclassified Haladaptatus TaxID=2622732 RepID=UPI0037549A4F